uniref:Uncharacterized protein n=1 Tax=Lotus japonicus TaxID=34305 RepID=I3T4A7_LOTJA|nr:unknown [Lotus japonicus]
MRSLEVSLQLNEMPLLVEFTTSQRKRKQLQVYWMVVESIL